MTSSIASKSERKKSYPQSDEVVVDAVGAKRAALFNIAVPFFWAGHRYSAFRLRMLFVC
jgi:hypothetical protein